MARKGTSKTTETGTKRGTKVESLRPGAARGEAVVGEGPASSLTHEKIAQRAKEIWERRGRPHGEDDRNWREAEEELKREMGSHR